MKRLSQLFLIFIVQFSYSQQKITLEDCYALANKNYPLAKQTELLQQKSNYEIEALQKGKLPKIDANAQATYQSDVTGLPIAMPNVTPLNKD